jgi:hypothetical protein
MQGPVVGVPSPGALTKEDHPAHIRPRKSEAGLLSNVRVACEQASMNVLARSPGRCWALASPFGWLLLA